MRVRPSSSCADGGACGACRKPSPVGQRGGNTSLRERFCVRDDGAFRSGSHLGESALRNPPRGQAHRARQ
ncbi:hypothetical protein BSIN_0795 [Burkholderia singularis]|uniref:Uncharacterized protein n=1 Tax=Burkholderia singularis TaxID=1503053 RepID=A0A238H9X5_9BURK|nr:hypothetical protein BSIN_0795 [Burkholderia singularis]